MKVLMTGGSGDLGTAVAARLISRGDTPISLDLRAPADGKVQFIQGSILDRPVLDSALPGTDCVVHIAAWHGIHEFRKEKDAFDFWNLNVTGTFTLLESCVRAGISKFVFISSTSVDDWPGIYAHSKLLGEDLMRTYMARHGMNIITLRPRAFIPHWNRAVYSTFADWAKWYWKGAVHVDDVCQSVICALHAVQSPVGEHNPLTIDGVCDFSVEELKTWDAAGPGTTFKDKFGEDLYQVAVKNGLNTARKPKFLDITQAQKVIGYTPSYGMANMLKELADQPA